MAKLFNEEVHVVVRPDVTDIKQLKGKVVNLGVPGSGTAITARLLSMISASTCRSRISPMPTPSRS